MNESYKAGEAFFLFAGKCAPHEAKRRESKEVKEKRERTSIALRSSSFTSSTSFTSFTSSHNRVGLDLDKHFWRNQFAHLHHACCGANFAEEFTVSAADLFPFGNVGHVDARAHHVSQRRSGFNECRFDVPDGLDRLRARIAHANNPAIGAGRCGAGDGDGVADAHRARVTHNRLPRRPAGNILPVHLWLSSM